MIPENICTRPKPASDLNVLLNDGTIHSFSLNDVAEVTVTQTCVVAHLYDATEAAPAPGEHTPATLSVEPLCVFCGDTAEPVGLDDLNCCPTCAHEAPIHTVEDALDTRQTSLLDFDALVEHHGSQKVAMAISNPDRLDDGRGHPPGVYNHCTRCRAVHRRACIRGPSYDPTPRCFDCANMAPVVAQTLNERRTELYKVNPARLYAAEMYLRDHTNAAGRIRTDFALRVTQGLCDALLGVSY